MENWQEELAGFFKLTGGEKRIEDFKPADEIERLQKINAELLEVCKALISNAVWDGKTREHGAANEYTVHRAVIEATQRAIMKAEGRKNHETQSNHSGYGTSGK